MLSVERGEDESLHFFNLLESQLAAVVQLTGIDYAAVYLTKTEHVQNYAGSKDYESLDNEVAEQGSIHSG